MMLPLEDTSRRSAGASQLGAELLPRGPIDNRPPDCFREVAVVLSIARDPRTGQHVSQDVRGPHLARRGRNLTLIQVPAGRAEA